ncbi:hypothetical protein F383_36639 [Gossypium arboreum]|uniref:Uncharacterized protein n=1 Tax=Gossypium arboreum TaxID=29729 RepID=A0A0B0MAD9_GOSAR|nr:hypothetical protein F383_36639 [Gossypium arboreum]
MPRNPPKWPFSNWT